MQPLPTHLPFDNTTQVKEPGKIPRKEETWESKQEYNPIIKYLSQKYNLTPEMVENLSKEFSNMYPPSTELTPKDYLQIYNMLAAFKEKIWDAIKSHAANKQTEKLQKTMEDLDKIDALVDKIRSFVPEHLRENV